LPRDNNPVPLSRFDCFTEGSMPKYATSLSGFEKAEKSPVSARIVAAVISPIPGMEQSKATVIESTGKFLEASDAKRA
jgi:hypothetical protein